MDSFLHGRLFGPVFSNTISFQGRLVTNFMHLATDLHDEISDYFQETRLMMQWFVVEFLKLFLVVRFK